MIGSPWRCTYGSAGSTVSGGSDVLSAVDLGDEVSVWVGMFAALALQNGGDPTAATAVAVNDLWNVAGTEMALAPIRQGR
jgi:hypothetical protein